MCVDGGAADGASDGALGDGTELELFGQRRLGLNEVGRLRDEVEGLEAMKQASRCKRRGRGEKGGLSAESLSSLRVVFSVPSLLLQRLSECKQMCAEGEKEEAQDYDVGQTQPQCLVGWGCW